LNVQDSLQRLTSNFEIHLVTSRLHSAREGTARWLAKRGFAQEIRLHFLDRHEKHLALGGFFAAIEDELKQAILFAYAGIHSFVYARPWNVTSDDSSLLHRLETWEAIESQLVAMSTD
jgi:hypothetical protein